MLRDPLKDTRDPLVPSAVPDFADKMALQVPTDGVVALGTKAEVRRQNRMFVWRTLIWALWMAFVMFAGMMVTLFPLPLVSFLIVCGLAYISWYGVAKVTDKQPLVGSSAFNGGDMIFAFFAGPIYFLLGGDPKQLMTIAFAGVGLVAAIGMMVTKQVCCLRLADLRIEAAVKRAFLPFWNDGEMADKATESRIWWRMGAGAIFILAACAAFWFITYGSGFTDPFYCPIVLLAVIAATWMFWLLVFEYEAVASVGASLRGILAFLTYNLHEAYGPGTFQFPDKWFCVAENRRLALVAAVVVFVPSLVVMSYPNPTGTSDALVRYVMGPSVKEPDKKDYGYGPPQSHERSYTHLLPPSTHPQTPWYSHPAYREYQKNKIAAERAAEARLINEALRLLFCIGAVLVLAPLIAFTVFTFLFGHMLLVFERLPKASAEKSTLDLVLDHTHTSAVPEERNALYLGQSLYGDHPVFLDHELFMRPGIIRGKPRVGKTSLLESMTYQVLRANAPERVKWLKANGIPYKPQKIVIVDMKGEDRWLQGTLEECRKLGVRCRVFTLKPGRESCLFNFFSQSRLDEMTTIDFTATLLKGMGLDHDSSGHGVDFWDNMNQIVAVNSFRQKYDLASFNELYEFLTTDQYKGEKKQIENASHLVALAQFLSLVPQLNLTEEDCKDKPDVWQNQIDVPSLLSGRTEVLYFHLDTVTQRKASIAAAKLFTMCLFAAICNRRKEDDAHIVAFFDEFQQIVSSNLDDLLAMGSSRGMSIVLSHQHREQLMETRGVDIRALADACNAWSVHFDWSDLETLKMMSDLSPKARIASMSFTQPVSTIADYRRDGQFHPSRVADGGPLGPVLAVGEKDGPVYHWNELKLLSAMPNVAIFRPTVIKGLSVYEDLFPFVWEHHVSREVATRRETAAWPKNFPGAFLPPLEYEPVKRPRPKGSELDERLRRALSGGGKPKGATS